MDARLAFAAELDARDGAVAGRLDTLARLGADVGALRDRAEQIGTFLERLPGERAHLDDADADAAQALERARRGLDDARLALERARGGDAREAAGVAEARAAAALHAAEEERDRLAERRAALEREAERLRVEARELDARARELAGELDSAPRVSATAPPLAGLAGAAEWAASAQAAILVARSGLESERERIVREANELASSVLGEPLHAANVAGVRRRLEDELG